MIYTKHEAMLELRLKDERTLLRLVRSGMLPYRKYGNRMMFEQEDINDYLRKIRRVGLRDAKQLPKKDVWKAVAEFKESLLNLLRALEDIDS